MKIMVFDVPAESGGALSVLNDFYNDVRSADDPDVRWSFVLGKAELEETERIEVLRFPWLKKSWIHRLYFDHIIAPRLVGKCKPDMILSLQNVVVPHTKVFQVLYVHQSLPFVEFRFGIRENFLFWVYQNLIGCLIFRSIKKADKVVVQTRWMKKACVEKTRVDESKIEVVPPRIAVEPKAFFEPTKDALSSFFYPAAPYSYKNHTLILDACKQLVEQGHRDFRVVFSLYGDENEFARMLLKRSKSENLPINFVGSLSREEVFDYYTRSILLFPSYIETFGLPMLEARMHGTIILASDCAFSHEILDRYENAHFFGPFDVGGASSLMRRAIMRNIIHVRNPLLFKKIYSDESLLASLLGLQTSL